MNIGNHNNSRSVNLIQFHFYSSKSNAVIHDFIHRAYNWYVKETEKTLDEGRYMYINQSKDKSDGQLIFKRYKLSDQKTFESIFLPEKEHLLKILNDFIKKKGIYQIKGYPYKFGLLLHGKPGTGKTSIIKAIASLTKRNIVYISLKKIKTNQDLMNIFYDKNFATPDLEIPIKLDFSKVIFVLEDIDCATDVVKSRKTKNSTSESIDITKFLMKDSIKTLKEKLTEKDLKQIMDNTTQNINNLTITLMPWIKLVF